MEEREGGRGRERERHRKRNKYTEWAEGRGETQGGGRGARGAERQEGRQRHAQGCEETHPQTCQGDTGRRRGRVGRAWRLGDTPPHHTGSGEGLLVGTRSSQSFLSCLEPRGDCGRWVHAREPVRASLGGTFPAGTLLLIPRAGPLLGPPAGRRLDRMCGTWAASGGWPRGTPTSTHPVTHSGRSCLPS